MKKKWLLSTALAVMVVIMLSACGSSKLNGSYQSTDGLITQTFTFNGDSVTMSAFGINANGTYEIEDDSIVITYTLLGQEYTWQQPFSRDGNSIYIGGAKFVKQ